MRVQTPPPARRATDRAITLLALGVALHVWAVTARLASRADPFAWFYGASALVVTVAALLLVRALLRTSADRRVRAQRQDDVP